MLLFTTNLAIVFFILVGLCNATQDEKCRLKPSASFFSEIYMDKKYFREISRKYSWCVDFHLCQENDILALVTFMETQCGYTNLLTKYVQDPYEMRKKVFALLKQNWHVFNR
jgi:hypothetical protein